MNIHPFFWFLLGVLTSGVAAYFYLRHVEHLNQCLHALNKCYEYDKGYAKGYSDRAMQSATGKLQTIES